MKKTKLALDLLEQEMELLGAEEMMGFVGGSAGGDPIYVPSNIYDAIFDPNQFESYNAGGYWYFSRIEENNPMPPEINSIVITWTQPISQQYTDQAGKSWIVIGGQILPDPGPPAYVPDIDISNLFGDMTFDLTTFLTNFNPVANLSTHDIAQLIGGDVYLKFQADPNSFSDGSILKFQYALNQINVTNSHAVNFSYDFNYYWNYGHASLTNGGIGKGNYFQEEGLLAQWLQDKFALNISRPFNPSWSVGFTPEIGKKAFIYNDDGIDYWDGQSFVFGNIDPNTCYGLNIS